jgi:anti-sigma regulatory factor (Ser/Thr protein kinase)
METTSTVCVPVRGAFSRELHLDISALAEMRVRLREYLRRRRVPVCVASDVVLCVQEAATNALRFGHGRRVEIAVWVTSGEVCVWVRDHGEGFRSLGAARRPDAWRTEGRGLYLMQSLMDQVSVDCTDGAVVCMRRRLPSKGSSHAA